MIKNCIVIDDEPIAREIVINYISQIPYLKLVGTCVDAFEAMEILKEKNIELIILDIKMPKLTGLGMLRSLQNPPSVIITSAYPEYALEGFELSVIDYLLKPFSFERFVQATEKAVKKKQEEYLITKKNEDIKNYLFVKSDKKLIKINTNEIQYIEAYGNYINIYINQDKIISKQTLSQFESQLSMNKFIRIHKSYIVSLSFINYLEGNHISVNKKLLPIGKMYRVNLMKILGKM